MKQPINSIESTNAPNKACHETDTKQHSLQQEKLANQENGDESSVSPSDNGILFRPLQEGDRDQIQSLHEDWFPVRYKSEFYDELVHHRMVNSGEELFTCAAVYEEEDQTMNGENLEYDRQVGEEADKKDDFIIGCIVGSFVSISRLSEETTGLLVSETSDCTKLFYIMTVGVITEFRHRDLGSKLVKRIIEMVENYNKDCGAIYLHVITHNHAAIRFYEKLGFVRVKEIHDYYRIDFDNHNCYLYAKYFHGNQGQRDLYYLASTFMTSLWKRLSGERRIPFLQSKAERGSL